MRKMTKKFKISK